MLLECWQVDHLLCNDHHIISWLILLWMVFVEKLFFSPMAVYSVDLVGCHAIVDHLHMPYRAFLDFLLQTISAPYTNIFIHDIYVIMFDIIWHKIVATYVLSCHHFHQVCVCAVSWHITVIMMLLLSHCLYHSLPCKTVVQFYEITCNDSMCTHIPVFDSVPLESLLLWLHLDT